jgi:hypothetical protein
VTDYIELDLDETIREGDFYLINSDARHSFIGNWIGLKVCEAPWEAYRPRSTLIRDAAIEVLRGAYSDDEYIDARALEDLRNAIGISIEELREEE